MLYIQVVVAPGRHAVALFQYKVEAVKQPQVQYFLNPAGDWVNMEILFRNRCYHSLPGQGRHQAASLPHGYIRTSLFHPPPFPRQPPLTG